MSQLGRISGPLLSENLLRDGVDLSFRNEAGDSDLLLLNVTGRKISVNTIGAQDLNVDDTAKTTDLIVTTGATIDTVTVSTNIFSTTSGGITISPEQTNPLVIFDKLQAGDLQLDGNLISNTAVNGSVALNPSGTGSVQMLSDATINGDLSVAGNFSILGNLRKNSNIIVGDTIYDTVTVVPDFTQSLIPGANITYDLGRELGDSTTGRWAEIYVHDNSNIANLEYNDFTIGEQLRIDSETASIFTLQSNDSVILNSATGIIDIESFRFQGNTITNLVADSAATVSSTGIGYVRFMDDNAVIIPAGTNAERYATPEVGDTRWNTDNPADQYLECFDGTVWNIATGPGGSISLVQNDDLGNAYILIFG